MRAAAIPLDHLGLKECLDYEACFIAPTAQVQCDIPKPTRVNGMRLILTSKFAGIYMYIRALTAQFFREKKSQRECWDFTL